MAEWLFFLSFYFFVVVGGGGDGGGTYLTEYRQQWESYFRLPFGASIISDLLMDASVYFFPYVYSPLEHQVVRKPGTVSLIKIY